MCGICGYKTYKKIPPDTIRRMTDALYHRGPDSYGFFKSADYSVGMRRLKINDLVTGDQPLYNEDRSVVLMYNGEIYNYPALRKDLESRGHKFSTHSDGEVICHLYEEYGLGLFVKIDGMFALALWIEKKKQLILARDIPGEKPLYYAQLKDREIVFASEIKSLKLFPAVESSLDYQAIWHLPTFLWIPEPQTIYKQVKALPKGHYLVVDSAKTRIVNYAKDFFAPSSFLKEKDAVSQTREIVTAAIKSRLLSDVPVGCFLSSGLDSSIVTTIAVRNRPDISSFTIGFEDIADPYHGRADESKDANSYAKHLGTKHHNIAITAADFRKKLPVFWKYGDQPFSVSSGLGILFVAEAARENGIKVLLSGDGADECFGGYSWYPYLNAKVTPDKKVTKQESISFQNIGQDINSRLKVMAGYSASQKAWGWHYYACEKEKRALFNPELFSLKSSSLKFFSEFKKAKQWDPEDFISQDRDFYLPNEMLRKVDRMTMAYSVEGRVPFTAPAVLDLARKIKYTDMVRGGILKYVLRQAFQKDIPQRIYQRPKHGFNVPIDHWLKGPWQDLVETSFDRSSALAKHGFIRKNSLSVAQQMLHDPNRLNGHTIFSFICLNFWMEENL